MQLQDRSLLAVVTLSGGGARAAAFGLGVLKELKDTKFKQDGQSTNLLDELTLISGVSGGSILAAHFVAFGPASLDRFEDDFLLSDFQQSLWGWMLSPDQLYRLSSPWYGRGNVLAARLDELFLGRTYADLPRHPGAIQLVVAATDLSTGAPFEFTHEQFSRICSDLGQVPLSFAVAASSAVPLLLAPLSLSNHAGTCELAAADVQLRPDDGYRARLRHESAQGYRNARERPFIHLVDGGLSDNLGVRVLMDRLVSQDAAAASLGSGRPHMIRTVVLIAVNSERDVSDRVDRSDRVPTTGQVLDTLVFGAAARSSQNTLGMLADDVRQWKRRLLQQRGTGFSPFAADAEIFFISVSLRDVADRPTREALLQVPTAFTIRDTDVRLLQQAGREVLRGSAEFGQLKDRLGAYAD